MSQLNGHGDESRRRKLDELFADEPYLSATMKARLLHEKLESDDGIPALPEFPVRAFVPPALATPPVRDCGVAAEDREPRVSFEMAKSFLSQPETAGAADSHLAAKLRAFREADLPQWLSFLPCEPEREALQ